MRTLKLIRLNVINPIYLCSMKSEQESQSTSAFQPSFDEISPSLYETTFVVVDLETTGGSHNSAAITEIGAVKVRAGEIVGEFQTLVNPESPIPPFITVLTGITDAMVIAAPKLGEAIFSFLEFVGSSKYVVTRDEAPNCKLSTLSTFFGATTNPDHRALSDARATVDVFHGILDRLGSYGVKTLEELKSFSARVTNAQRSKRYLAEGLPNTPGVYIFRDESGTPLYIGTTRNLRNRVRSYFTAAETRKRIHDMISLAHSLDVIQTATIIEAEVRELRLICEKQPRFNRRSKFQAKSLWIKLTKEAFPRLVAIRGAKGLDDESGWAGPFNGRDESARAIEALYEVTQIRQCKPRITLSSMKNASPCALFDMKRCGAPCIGQESIDSYSSHVTAIHQSLHIDSRPILNSLNERMKELANQERFEEAAEVRNRLGALIRGSARAQSIRSLTRVKELIAAIATSIDTWEFVVIRHGKLAASATAKSDNYKEVVESLKLTAEVVIDNGEILPASHHEEVEVLLRYLNQEGIRIVEIDGIWALPTFGSAAARSEIEKVRAQVGANSYKEDFANSVDRFAQRSTN